MNDIIKQIRKIIGNFDPSHIQINIGIDEIWFNIYESEVPLIIDLKNKEVYVDCEGYQYKLNGDMLIELGEICTLIESNLNVIEDLLK
ncbi:MAG: hypothetical protein M0Q94_10040 [Candidatus Cloacimonetes bacterium]|jgi:hypothetical protein|nr:hypothetical protein [Candidatus Cloacimonadota bacterium]